MSVDVASLPAWKIALLERKRRQEVDSHGKVSKSDGNETKGNIPPWKQDILFRKQQRKLTMGRTYEGPDDENRRSLTEILLSPGVSETSSRIMEPWPVLLSPIRDASGFGDPKTTYHQSSTAVDRSGGSNTIIDIPVEEERLPPVHQNPILLLDLEKRHQSGVLVGLSSPGANDLHRIGLLSKLPKLQVSSQQSSDGDGSENILCPKNEIHDEVFREEEVTYGKGFVSRLLQKFSYLSGREDRSIEIPPQPFSRSLIRGQSSEDFTKNLYDTIIRSKNPTQKKTNSLDDLLMGSASSRSVVENSAIINGNDEQQGTTECYSEQEGRTEGSIVLSAKSIFESLAMSPTSLRNPLFQDRHLALAKELHEKQDSRGFKEKQNKPIFREPKDNKETPPGLTAVQARMNESSSASIAQHPPAIIGPKPVYTGYSASQHAAKPPLKKRLDTYKIGSIKVADNTTADARNHAQISLTSDWVAVSSLDDAHESHRANKTVVSTSDSRSSFDIKETSNLRQTEDGESHRNVSTNVHEPPKIDTQFPAHSNSVLIHSPPVTSDQPDARHEKLDEMSHKENAAVPKKTPPRPGLLLIRPASNLVTRTENLQMTKYNDITRGEFAPAKRLIHKEDGKEDDNSDVDELDGTGDFSRNQRIRYEFEGAGVRIGRSLLAKTKQGIQLKISFDDSATSTYEYPSEQALIDSLPPVPSDAVGCPSGEENAEALPSPAEPDHSEVDSGPVSDASSVSSEVALSSDKSTTQADVAFNSCIRKNDGETLAPSSILQPEQETDALHSDNVVSQSDTTSSDHVLL